MPSPKKVRKMAMRIALTTKLQQGKLLILDDLSIASHKTKEFQKVVENLTKNSVFIVGDKQLNENLILAARNIDNVTVAGQNELNVYDILKRDMLILSKQAIPFIEKAFRLW